MFSFARTTAAPADRSAPLRKLAAAAALTLAVSGAAAAVSVGFVATNLADTVAGQDLWRYDYTLFGGLSDGHSVSLLFSPSTYAQLVSLGADTRLAAFAAEPSPTVPFDGMFQLSALFGPIAAADPAPTAALQFVWSGSGTPAEQPFEHLNDSFSVVGTGVTAPVPEAGTAAMLASGLVALGWLARRRSARRR